MEILKKELEAEGVEVLALAFDVRNREAAKKAVDYIPEEWRNVDAVSYTHLDVYKRQTPQCALCITNSPVHTLEYYMNIADQLIAAGAEEICLKAVSYTHLP